MLLDSLHLFLEIRKRCQMGLFMAAHNYSFSIYNACYAPLLCKRGMMKRILSLRNGNPAAPPPPGGYKCWWEVQQCTLGENPLYSHSCRNGLLGLFTFGVLLLCIRRMDRKTLMKSINYSRSILLTVSLLISQPCTFTTHLLTLQEQQGNISPACLCFCFFYGEDIENVINFLALQCSKFAATQVCASPVLILLSRVESRKWECNCLDFLCSACHLFRVYFSTAGEIKQKLKGRTATHVQRSWVLLVGLDLNTVSLSGV